MCCFWFLIIHFLMKLILYCTTKLGLLCMLATSASGHELLSISMLMSYLEVDRCSYMRLEQGTNILCHGDLCWGSHVLPADTVIIQFSYVHDIWSISQVIAISGYDIMMISSWLVWYGAILSATCIAIQITRFCMFVYMYHSIAS